jgi:hypothetical protein
MHPVDPRVVGVHATTSSLHVARGTCGPEPVWHDPPLTLGAGAFTENGPAVAHPTGSVPQPAGPALARLTEPHGAPPSSHPPAGNTSTLTPMHVWPVGSPHVQAHVAGADKPMFPVYAGLVSSYPVGHFGAAPLTAENATGPVQPAGMRGVQVPAHAVPELELPVLDDVVLLDDAVVDELDVEDVDELVVPEPDALELLELA